MQLRPMTLDDYDQVAAFWQAHGELGDRDGRNQIDLFLSKNPNLSTLAFDEDELVGTCLGSFDGRMGYFQKVVVHPDRRGQGIGKQLVLETVKKMNEAGATEIRVDCDHDHAPFYQSCGFVPYAVSSYRIKES